MMMIKSQICLLVWFLTLSEIQAFVPESHSLPNAVLPRWKNIHGEQGVNNNNRLHQRLSMSSLLQDSQRKSSTNGDNDNNNNNNNNDDMEAVRKSIEAMRQEAVQRLGALSKEMSDYEVEIKSHHTSSSSSSSSTTNATKQPQPKTQNDQIPERETGTGVDSSTIFFEDLGKSRNNFAATRDVDNKSVSSTRSKLDLAQSIHFPHADVSSLYDTRVCAFFPLVFSFCSSMLSGFNEIFSNGSVFFFFFGNPFSGRLSLIWDENQELGCPKHGELRVID